MQRVVVRKTWTLATISVALVFASACSSKDELPGPGTMPASQGSTPATSAAPGAGGATDGESAVKARKCADCHGAALSGAVTPLAGYPQGVSLFAPNLTPDPETGIGSWTDGQLRLAIREGLDKEGMVLCPQMQHYRTMPDAEVDAIIAYLRKLPPAKNVVRESICPPLKR